MTDPLRGNDIPAGERSFYDVPRTRRECLRRMRWVRSLVLGWSGRWAYEGTTGRALWQRKFPNFGQGRWP